MSDAGRHAASLLECVLFSNPDWVDTATLREVTGGAFAEGISILQARYNDHCLIRLEKTGGDSPSYRLIPASRASLPPKPHNSEEKALSDQALKILALIAMYGPITFRELEARRDISGMGRALLTKLESDGFICRAAKAADIRNADTWIVTHALLKSIGMTNADDFPTAEEIKAMDWEDVLPVGAQTDF